MEEELGIPFLKVSFFGVEDTTNSLMRVAYAIGDAEVIRKAQTFTEVESAKLQDF